MAGLWSDRHQCHAVELLRPAPAELLLQQLRCVLHGFAAAEGDRIHGAGGQGGGGGFRQRVGAARFIGGHFHHTGSCFPEGFRQHGAPSALHSRQQQPQPPARHREVIDQAVGHELGWHEIRRCTQRLQPCGCFAAHRCDLQAPGPARQAAAQPLQPCLHRIHAIAARHHQPMEFVELRQGIVERAPLIRRADHKGWEIQHRGASLLKQPPRFAQLLLCPGDGDGAALQRGRVWHRDQPSSFTMAPACWRSWAASLLRPCWPSSSIAWRKLLRAPSISPPSSRATARF